MDARSRSRRPADGPGPSRAPLIAPRIRISLYGDESARCSGSNRLDLLSASSVCAPPFATPSTPRARSRNCLVPRFCVVDRGIGDCSEIQCRPLPASLLLTLCWRGIVWMPSAGQERFWLGTVMPVAGLCPACSRANVAGLDGLSASRSSHLDFALDAHPLAAGLPR